MTVSFKGKSRVKHCLWNMVSYTTAFSLLALLLSVSIPHSTGKRQCAEVIDNPRPVFNQSDVYTEPLAAYMASDLVDCMGICCYDEINCNVGVYMESSPSDINCWLYSCYTLDSCAIEIRKRSIVFVNYHQTTDIDNINTSQNLDHPTPVYEDSNVDNTSKDWYIDYSTAFKKNETDKNASKMVPSLEGTIVSTPPSMTSELASVTQSGLISETTHNTLLSLATESIFQYDTFTMPDNEASLKNDTFTTPLNEPRWENDTIYANISKEIEGNIASESLFTKENDTGHENDTAPLSIEDEYNIESITLWAAEDQVTSTDSSSSLSTSEGVLAQTPSTIDLEFYSIQQTLHSEDSVIHPTYTTPFIDSLVATQIFSSGDWSTFVVGTDSDVGSTVHLSTQGGDSLAILESEMTVNSSSDVSATRPMAEEGVTNSFESTETSPMPQQSAKLTSDIFPPSDLQPQDSPNGTESRADINYEPSEATTGLLVSALTVGCVCALAVMLVLSFRIYDGYKKRHYSRLDYLINGIYN